MVVSVWVCAPCTNVDVYAGVCICVNRTQDASEFEIRVREIKRTHYKNVCLCVSFTCDYQSVYNEADEKLLQ